MVIKQKNYSRHMVLYLFQIKDAMVNMQEQNEQLFDQHHQQPREQEQEHQQPQEQEQHQEPLFKKPTQQAATIFTEDEDDEFFSNYFSKVFLSIIRLN